MFFRSGMCWGMSLQSSLLTSSGFRKKEVRKVVTGNPELGLTKEESFGCTETLGVKLGWEVGLDDGCVEELGALLGSVEGMDVGLDDGSADGVEVGLIDGVSVGLSLGIAVGDKDGLDETEGKSVGYSLRNTVGSTEGLNDKVGEGVLMHKSSSPGQHPHEATTSFSISRSNLSSSKHLVTNSSWSPFNCLELSPLLAVTHTAILLLVLLDASLLHFLLLGPPRPPRFVLLGDKGDDEDFFCLFFFLARN